MIALRPPRRAALLAAGLMASGALAAYASAPAQAYTQIYGSGAALQELLQTQILIPNAPSLGSSVTFTASTSGKGFAEFGNGTGTLAPGEDSVAGKLNTPELDAYVAVDSGPSTTELANARHAATGNSASPEENEIAVPVAQTPLDLLLSLPVGITLNGSQNIDLTATLAGQLYAGTVPAAGTYATNTWGALLTDVGLKETGGTPSTGEFEESSGAGATTISVEVRKNGAGTTLNLKQYLHLVDTSDWGSIPVDENAYVESSGPEWPAGATILPASKGNGTDAEEVLAVDGTPGTVGYATAGDVAANEVGGKSYVAFTDTPKTSTDPPSTTGSASASHQIVYALLQDNYISGSRTPAIYANPEANGSGTANVYTGANIKVSTSAAGGVGSWVIPNTNGTFDAAGTWTGTQGSDPDVYDDSGDSIAYYPLVAVAFDLSWSNFAAVQNANYTSEAQLTTSKFLSFATSIAGQSEILGKNYYAPLPTNPGNSSLADILADANAAAGEV